MLFNRISWRFGPPRNHALAQVPTQVASGLKREQPTPMRAAASGPPKKGPLRGHGTVQQGISAHAPGMRVGASMPARSEQWLVALTRGPPAWQGQGILRVEGKPHPHHAHSCNIPHLAVPKCPLVLVGTVNPTHDCHWTCMDHAWKEWGWGGCKCFPVWARCPDHSNVKSCRPWDHHQWWCHYQPCGDNRCGMFASAWCRGMPCTQCTHTAKFVYRQLLEP